MSNPKFKELYEELADEEAGHITYLEVYRDTKGLPIVSTKVRNGQSFIPEFNITHTKQFIMLQMYDQQTTFPPEFDTTRTTSGEATLGGDAGILVAAMRHERKSEDFYSELAKKPKAIRREPSSRCYQDTKEAIMRFSIAISITSPASGCRPERTDNKVQK